MTITVQCGITVSRLQAILAPENLRLPIEVPQAESATLAADRATLERYLGVADTDRLKRGKTKH